LTLIPGTTPNPKFTPSSNHGNLNTMILIKPTTTNIGPLRHGTVKIGPLPNRTANMIRNGMPGASGVATNPNLPPPILSRGGIHLPPKSLHPTNATPPQNINPFPNLLQLIQGHTNRTLQSPLHWARSANLPNTNIGKIIERLSHPRQTAALVSPYKMTHKRTGSGKSITRCHTSNA
jgi:hypothetical protein